MNRYILLCLLSLSFFSCENKDKSTTNGKKELYTHNTQADITFDSLMSSLKTVYPEIKKPEYDSLTYNKVYETVKKVVVKIYRGYNFKTNKSNDYNLNFELREYVSCRCAHSKVIYIYNDSINFVLPLTDFDAYIWSSDSKSLKPVPENQLNFTKELNKLVKLVKAENNLQIAETIMFSILEFNKLDKYDIPKIEMMAKDIQTRRRIDIRGYTHNFNESCKNKLVENIKQIREKVEEKNHFLYYKGMLTFIYALDQKDSIKIEILNSQCLPRTL